MTKKIVLAYSGGLDTSACIPWLLERGYEVIGFMADVGQKKNLKPAIQRGLRAGATKILVEDLKKEFIQDFVWPALKANVLYENQYNLATALSRPLIAKELVRAAHREGAAHVAHGCTGKGNDQVRFEVTVRILDNRLRTIAPVREWDLKSREAEIEYVRSKNIPIDVTKKSPYSIDENLWGVSIECGVLENPWCAPPKDCYLWTRGAESRKLKPRVIEIDFKKGIPVALNGRKLSPLALIERLNKLASQYGIGRTDMVENRLVGIKSREVYEAPAATLLIAAHRDLESLTMDRYLCQYKENLTLEYAKLVYNGLWFTPLKKAMDNFFEVSQRRVTGTVRMKLTSFAYHIIGRKSPYSLYRENLATYSDADIFDQELAKGFIDLYAMPYSVTGKTK